MIDWGDELIRISPKDECHLEYSSNDGRSWHTRYTGSSAGEFRDLLGYGDEIIAATDKGIYYSSNDGRSWHSRYTGNSAGEFEELSDNGDEILATTDKGLYYSKNEGRSWHRR